MDEAKINFTINSIAEKIGIIENDIKNSLIPELARREILTHSFKLVICLIIIIVIAIGFLKNFIHRTDNKCRSYEIDPFPIFIAFDIALIFIVISIFQIISIIEWVSAPQITAISYIVNMIK